MSILAERQLTDAERDAVADHERPGVWIEVHFDDPISPHDGRTLSQHATDLLIVNEVLRREPDHADELRPFLPPRGVPMSWLITLGDGVTATQQRGGIHSDPLVRLLAYRTWGDRDRTWRKRDSAEPFLADEIDGAAVQRIYGFDEIELVPIVAHGKQPSLRLFARRGDRRAQVAVPEPGVRQISVLREALLDALDALERQLG
ncbi:MAG: hypothetical protein WKG01_25350 [Kofleriaceae bacterium]